LAGLHWFILVAEEWSQFAVDYFFGDLAKIKNTAIRYVITLKAPSGEAASLGEGEADGPG